jgi:hypothetical protein
MGDMNETTEQLVALYAEHGTDGVRRIAAFQALCDAHAADTGFDSAQTAVKRVLAELERNVDNHDHPEQVRFALETLNAFKLPDDRRILRKLVRARYFQWWSDDQQNYFDWAAERLEWQDYFLSFTSYNPTDDVNAVNSAHKYLIRDQIPNNWEERQADSRANLLAKMLDTFLHNRQLEGFFWERHKGDSSDVEAKLRTNAQQALTFVQLLQSAMFVKQPPPNFCQLEYELAVADESRTLVFVRAEPLASFIERSNVDIGLRRWYDDIVLRDPYELASTRRWAQTTIDANLEGIESNVVARVKRARESLFEGVPR